MSERAEVHDLRHEPEIFPHHRELPQILSEGAIVPDIHVAVGFASRCWVDSDEGQVFDTDQAQRLANELCAYVRLVHEGKITR